MQFLISDTFTESLSRLNGEEQKLTKITALDLQMNASSPGLQLHRLDKARDKNFWSARAGRDLRVIVHRLDGNMLLCYAAHHDDAYAWAERRRIETHPKTGAVQIVEIKELVKEILVPVYVEEKAKTTAKPHPLQKISDEELLEYGVPEDWIEEVRRADESSILNLAMRLPKEAGEALLEIWTGGSPAKPQAPPTGGDPFQHPDTLRRFREVSNKEDLQAAMDFPWDKWTIFLHPEQKSLVEKTFNGPARVTGSAGTGKTIVAIHRAAWLAEKNPDSRILLATFSDTLANSLGNKLRRLLAPKPRIAERVDVTSLRSLAIRLHEKTLGPCKTADKAIIQSLIAEASKAIPNHKFSPSFLWAEWTQVFDPWQIKTWDAYRTVPRIGRKSRLPEKERQTIWSIFEKVLQELSQSGQFTEDQVFDRLAEGASKNPLYDAVVIDESQDISVAQLRYLAALAGNRPNALFFAGDTGQRIFELPFSWKTVGVDIVGRSKTLRVNYRTSHQIRSQADKLLEPEISDVDGNREKRNDTVSVFEGEPPSIKLHDSEKDECANVADWITAKMKSGIEPQEIAVIVRSEEQIPRAEAALAASKREFKILDQKLEPSNGKVNLCTMHQSKGLEFRSVVVMACDDNIIPLESRMLASGDDTDLGITYETERQLLYVACTRARDHLLVTAVKPGSEFLEDLMA
jgi:hypothetical protein